MLSAFCLLLYSAGFIRIELKFDDHDQRLMAVEEVISQMKEDNDKTMRALNEGRMYRRTLNLAIIECLIPAVSVTTVFIQITCFLCHYK